MCTGDRVRVTIHLEQVSPEGQLWTNQYNNGIRDVMVLEDEIALRAQAAEICISSGRLSGSSSMKWIRWVAALISWTIAWTQSSPVLRVGTTRTASIPQHQ